MPCWRASTASWHCRPPQLDVILTTALPVAQDVRESHAVLARFHGIMGDLLAEVRRTPPSANSIAAHLLDIDDPRTGAQRPHCQ